MYAPVTSMDSSEPTARARPQQCGCCLGWCFRPLARRKCWACRCPPRAKACYHASDPWWRLLVPTHISPAQRTSRSSMPRADRSPRAGATRPDQYGSRAGRTQRSRSAASPDLLAGDAPAARAGSSTDAQTAAVDLGRAEQWPRPARHSGDPETAPGAERPRDDHLPLQPSTGRDRADVHPRRCPAQRAIDAAGTAGHAAATDRSGRGPDSRYRPLHDPARSRCGVGRR